MAVHALAGGPKGTAMPTITIRLADELHEHLTQAAYTTGLSISAYLRPIIEDALQGRLSDDSERLNEIIRVAIQAFALVGEDISRRSPEALAAGMRQSRRWLEERLLIDPEDADSQAEGGTDGR
jgi:predicted transcriptional regulator